MVSNTVDPPMLYGDPTTPPSRPGRMKRKLMPMGDIEAVVRSDKITVTWNDAQVRLWPDGDVPKIFEALKTIYGEGHVSYLQDAEIETRLEEETRLAAILFGQAIAVIDQQEQEAKTRKESRFKQLVDMIRQQQPDFDKDSKYEHP